jgi:hypothetical protein
LESKVLSGLHRTRGSVDLARSDDAAGGVRRFANDLGGIAAVVAELRPRTPLHRPQKLAAVQPHLASGLRRAGAVAAAHVAQLYCLSPRRNFNSRPRGLLRGPIT